MKKLIVTSVAMSTLACAATLSSCSNKKDTTLFLVERQYQIKTTKNIELVDLSSKMENKESFVLLISNPFCEACSIVEPFINSYIKSTQAVIYNISTSSLPASNSYVPYSVTPTLAIIKDGKVADKIDYLNNESVFASSSTIKKYLDSNVSLSPQIEINEEQFDELKANKETFILLFRWNKCGDCLSMNSYFFDKYISSHQKNEFYSFELSEKYAARDPELKSNDPNWKAFTKKVELSKEGNEEFGYNNGVVPTFQYIEKGQVKDAVVVYNDGMTANKNDDNEVVSITITSSYFKDAPFINKTYESTGDMNYYQNYKSSTASFYEGKVVELFKHLYK